MRKLEIGGGGTPAGDGYEQVDVEVRWGYQPLPYEDGAFDEVYAAHVIEHVPWFLTRTAIADAVRVLKPGGVLEIHTVDFRKIVGAYQARRALDGWNARGRNPEVHPMRWMTARLFCLDDDPGGPMWHKALFDFDYLHELFCEAGLVRIGEAKLPKGPEKHGVINVGIRGVKP